MSADIYNETEVSLQLDIFVYSGQGSLFQVRDCQIPFFR